MLKLSELDAMEKRFIRGTATLDQPGILCTRAGAERFARQNMPRDLRKAGFLAYVCAGQEVHNGRYRDCWNINYGK